jgi:hypothetical protein
MYIAEQIKLSIRQCDGFEAACSREQCWTCRTTVLYNLLITFVTELGQCLGGKFCQHSAALLNATSLHDMNFTWDTWATSPACSQTLPATHFGRAEGAEHLDVALPHRRARETP